MTNQPKETTMQKKTSMIEIQNVEDEYWGGENVKKDGFPSGGEVHGYGIDIYWQDGPRGYGDDSELEEPNGAFVEWLIDIAIQRLEFFQASQFECEENGAAIEYLSRAASALEERRQERASRGVEGTHIV